MRNYKINESANFQKKMLRKIKNDNNDPSGKKWVPELIVRAKSNIGLLGKMVIKKGSEFAVFVNRGFDGNHDPIGYCFYYKNKKIGISLKECEVVKWLKEE